MKTLATLVAAACVLLTSARLPAAAEDDLLWRIGSCDNDYAEFAIARDYPAYSRLFSDGVGFEVGKSDPAKHWPFIQPGTNDAWAGSREHPRQIVFDLDRAIDDVCALRVDFVDVHSSGPPTLTIRVNDISQSFPLGPGVSDTSLSNPANGREQIVTMYVRAQDLKVGPNTVTLTLSKGSWVLYDCISMAECAEPPKAVENLQLRSTFLFKKRDGALRPIVVASADLFVGRESIRAELTGEDGWRVEQEFTNTPAGHSDLEIEAPEVSEPQNVHLRLSVGEEVFEADATIAPQKKWRIYMMPSSHLDIGYTGRQDRTAQTHIDNLTRALTWCRKYPDFIWDLEGSLVAQDYFEKGPHPKTLIEMAKQGRIGVMGFYGNELTGICSSEGLVRLVDYYDYLRHKYGIESKCAMMTDVPTMVATVPMILAGHGIKYLSHGVNATRARPDQEFYNTPHYWQSPDGSRVLMWKAPGYGYASQITGHGDRGSLESAARKVNEILSQYASRNDYPFDAILLHGAYSDNVPNGEALASVPDQWNRLYEYPRLIFTTGPEFFEHIERNFAGNLKTVKGDGGVWWEDGAGSSAYETAITRVAKENLITAEKLAVLCGKKLQDYFAADFAEAWKNVLYYDEHTWGAAQSISQPDSEATREQWEVKKRFADRASDLSWQLIDATTREFFSHIRPQRDSMVVFNPSSWPRSGWVSAGEDPRLQGHEVYAESVPPLGYKVFPEGALPEHDIDVSSRVLENRFYRITFDEATGAIKSIFDKELARELVDPSQYLAGQYLYVTGGEDPRVLNCDLSRPIPDLRKETTSTKQFSGVSSSAYQTMKVHGSAPYARRFYCSVTLHAHEKRIDLHFEVDKSANLAKEAGYVAFPFAFKNPKIRIEIPNGVIRPEVDQTKGACRDWYCVQGFVTISDDNAAVVWTPIDSPLVTLQDINRGQWYDHIQITNGNVFAYIFNNYWFTNYKASQDHLPVFRFSMTSAGKISDLDAKSFGESVRSPMICRLVTPGDGPMSPTSRSFVRLASDNVIVQAMKPARFANGTIIRLREMNGQDCNARLTIDGIPFKRAYLCNLAEDKLSRLTVTNGSIDVPCRALGLATVLLEL